MGTIEVGKRADFVMLDRSPLEGTGNLAEIWAVSLRGTWLGKDALGRIEDALEATFDEAGGIPPAGNHAFETLVSEMEALNAAGFPYPDYALEEIENLLDELGRRPLAKRVDALQVKQGVPIETP